MKIEDRVFESISKASEGRFDLALELICPAIEATARKTFSPKRITSREFISFIRSYYWLIERFAGEGLNFEQTRFPNLTIESDNMRTINAPDLAQVVYHLYRCSLAHGYELSNAVSLIPTSELGRHRWEVGLDGKTLRAPEALLWSLIATVVFCRSNQDICTMSDFHLTWGGGPRQTYQFHIDVFWGAEDVLRRLFQKLPAIRVAMQFD